MKFKTRTIATTAIIVALAGGALAQSAVDGAIKARKAHMQLYAFNLGPLGAMAKGEMPYDAEAATAAANNLVALTELDGSRYWPEGSAQGEAEGSRALPAIWESGSDVGAKAGDLKTAVADLASAAGTDLESLQAAMGPVGAACGACHKAYRASE